MEGGLHWAVLEPAACEGTKKLSREHMVVGKDAVAGAPVLAVDRSTNVETVGSGKEEQGHYHGGGDSPCRQVVSARLEDLTSTASHAAAEEAAAWVAHAALGADGDSSCPKRDTVPACLSSSEIKRCFANSHTTRE